MKRILLTLVACGVAGCAGTTPGSSPASAVSDRAAASIASLEGIERHTRELASDRYQGRFPGTDGEELSVDYIEREMGRLGLAPGNPDGGWVQRFDLLAQRSRVVATLASRGVATPLDVPRDAGFAFARGEPHTTLRDSELVFVGYGIAAPEYGWDDYAGVDVRGKTVLVIRGEPDLPDRPDLFRGRQLSYHAEMDRKYRVARERGAAAVLLATQGIGLFRAVRTRGEYLSLGTEPWPGVIGAFHIDLTNRVFVAAGRSFPADSAAAGRPGFRSVGLGMTLSLEAETTWRRIPTRNVIGRLEGMDARLRDEYVVLSAHWDAFGSFGPAVDGDSIHNGAVDDAVGVGQLLAVAEALVAARPRRTVLFLATSAEEHGLLGARYYATHPLYPLEHTVGNVNFDIVHLSGPTRDVTLHGAGRSTLDDIVTEAARLQGRVTEPEREAQLDTWFRVDHFAFAEVGVPGVSLAAGNDVIGKPTGYSERMADEYRSRHYHRPSDEVREDWDWGSIVQNAQLGVLVALRLANDPGRPRWKPGSEFSRATGVR